jgi:hypothetical protein
MGAAGGDALETARCLLGRMKQQKVYSAFQGWKVSVGYLHRLLSAYWMCAETCEGEFCCQRMALSLGVTSMLVRDDVQVE